MALRIRPRLPSTIVAAVLAAASVSAAAERRWLEVKTPHFVVVTNTGEGTARDVGGQFEQVRYVFETLWPWARRGGGRPLVVIALRDEADMKALAPEYWERGHDGVAGLTVSGADKDYVALQPGVALPDDLRTNPYYFAYWGYADCALRAVFPQALPMWFVRGLSDLFGNTLVRGKDVQVGRLLGHHLRTLNGSVRIPLPELLAADRKSRYFTDDTARSVFDAEAWLFVHYLVFGDKGAHQAQLNRFAELLRDGRPPEIALREGLGDLAAVEKGFAFYVGREMYAYSSIKGDLNVKPAGFEVRPLSPAAGAAVRAAFHVAMRRPREARALIEEARRTEPASVLASEAEALLLDAQDQPDGALAAYARATEGGSENFYMYYRRASLMQRGEAPKETLAQIAGLLDRATRLNPDDAWSQASLARALAQTEPGDRAIDAAKKAIALEPTVAAHHIALVQAFWTASRPEEARREAQAALRLATDEADRRYLQQWIGFMDRAGAPVVGAARPSPEPAGGSAAATEDWQRELTRACEAGSTSACQALAILYTNRLAASLARARELLDKACRGGDARACESIKSLPR
jgi:hypothetical protein